MSCRYREQTLIPPDDDNAVVDSTTNGALTREQFKDGSIGWRDSIGPMPSTMQGLCDEAWDMAVHEMERRIDNIRTNVKQAIETGYTPRRVSGGRGNGEQGGKVRTKQIVMSQAVSITCDSCGEPIHGEWRSEACAICGGDYHEKCVRRILVDGRKRPISLCKTHFAEVRQFIDDLSTKYEKVT